MASSTDVGPNIRDPPEGKFPFDLDLQMTFTFSFPPLSAFSRNALQPFSVLSTSCQPYLSSE